MHSRRWTAAAHALALTALGGTAACQPQDLPDPDGDRPVQWVLPNSLQEISGLTFGPGGRLYGHDDERAIIYQLDYTDGRIRKSFSLGNPVETGDFEGIACVGERFFLVTSDGTLYETTEGADRASVDFRKHRTGAGKHCEIEGLEYEPATQMLLLACKTMKKRKADYRIFAWSPASGEMDDDAGIEISRKALAGRAGTDDFNPSALMMGGGGDTLVLLAARQRAVAEIDRDGNVLRAGRLRFADRHPQPEGIAMAADGAVIVADEGRNGRPRLTVYAPGQDLE